MLIGKKLSVTQIILKKKRFSFNSLCQAVSFDISLLYVLAQKETVPTQMIMSKVSG